MILWRARTRAECLTWAPILGGCAHSPPLPAIDILFDFAAVHVIGDKAAGADLRIDFAFTDHGQTWTMWIKRGVLNARRGASPDTQLTVSGPKAALVGVVLQPAAASQLAQAGKIKLDGDESALANLAGIMDEFDLDFNIVTP